MRLILFLSLLVFSTFSTAENYSWSINHQSMVYTGPTPRDVCDWVADRLSNVQSQTYTYSARCVGVSDGSLPTRKTITTETDWIYRGEVVNTDISHYTVNRSGDTCPDGTTYNPETGECEQDCSDTIGQNLLVRGPDSPIFNSNGQNYVLASASDVDGTCTSSCRYDSISSFAGSCYLVSGSTDTGYCNYIVTGTGESCSTHNLTPGDMSGDPLNTPPDGGDGGDGGDPDEPDPCHGVPGYAWNGSTCVSTGGGDGDGDGDGDGGDNGGGGGPGNGGDGDGDGDGGPGSGEPGNGDGDGNGEGDGEGDCDPSSEECGDSESEVSGEACDATVDCKGDAIMCAILRQEKAQYCLQEELFEVTEEKNATLKSNLETHFAGEDYQPLETDADNTFDFSNMLDTSSRFSKSCPTVPDLTVPWIRGFITVPFSTVLADLCSYLVWFGYFVVAFAMRRAAEIIALGMN